MDTVSFSSFFSLFSFLTFAFWPTFAFFLFLLFLFIRFLSSLHTDFQRGWVPCPVSLFDRRDRQIYFLNFPRRPLFSPFRRARFVTSINGREINTRRYSFLFGVRDRRISSSEVQNFCERASASTRSRAEIETFLWRFIEIRYIEKGEIVSEEKQRKKKKRKRI